MLCNTSKREREKLPHFAIGPESILKRKEKEKKPINKKDPIFFFFSNHLPFEENPLRCGTAIFSLLENSAFDRPDDAPLRIESTFPFLSTSHPKSSKPSPRARLS